MLYFGHSHIHLQAESMISVVCPQRSLKTFKSHQELRREIQQAVAAGLID